MLRVSLSPPLSPTPSPTNTQLKIQNKTPNQTDKQKTFETKCTHSGEHITCIGIGTAATEVQISEYMEAACGSTKT